jgi:hypothetical protein
MRIPVRVEVEPVIIGVEPDSTYSQLTFSKRDLLVNELLFIQSLKEAPLLHISLFLKHLTFFVKEIKPT